MKFQVGLMEEKILIIFIECTNHSYGELDIDHTSTCILPKNVLGDGPAF